MTLEVWTVGPSVIEVYQAVIDRLGSLFTTMLISK